MIALATLVAVGLGAAPAFGASARALKLTVRKRTPVGIDVPAAIAIRVKNVGPGRASGVRLAVGAPRGVTVTPRRKRIGTLGRGRARTLKVHVTRSLRARTTALKLRLSARAKHRRAARRSVRMPLGLAGRYFWSADPFDEIDYDSYYFVDARWAYRGAPAGGLPPRCPAPSANAGEGCVRYHYRPASGAMTVADQHGTVTNRGRSLSIDDEGYSELAPPPAGARYAIGWSALFGGSGCTINCTFVSSGLTLTQDGKFARSVAATGSFADTDFAVMPADQHGTYTIAGHGRLQLAYADGHSDDSTLVVFLDDQGELDPGYGMLLNGSLYTGPTF